MPWGKTLYSQVLDLKLYKACRSFEYVRLFCTCLFEEWLKTNPQSWLTLSGRTMSVHATGKTLDSRTALGILNLRACPRAGCSIARNKYLAEQCVFMPRERPWIQELYRLYGSFSISTSWLLDCSKQMQSGTTLNLPPSCETGSARQCTIGISNCL